MKTFRSEPHLQGRDLVWVVTPCGRPDPGVVRAAHRAGAVGILDLGLDRAKALEAIAATAARVPAFGVLVSSELELAPADLPDTVDLVVLPVSLAGNDAWRSWAGGQTRQRERRLIAEVTSADEAADALASGAHGILAKGAESAGRVGTTGAFVLLQQVLTTVERSGRAVPVWVRGGIGAHTAAAAIVGGAIGVVVDSQVALLRESTLVEPIRRAIAAMDGTEARVVAGYRVYHRPDLWIASFATMVADGQADGTTIATRLQGDSLGGETALPVGQDGALAKGFAQRWRTVGRAVTGIRTAIREHIEAAAAAHPLSAERENRLGSPLPIAQGPMTRVSDQPAFAEHVADGGGMPFLALGVVARRRGPHAADRGERAARRPSLGRRDPRVRAQGAPRRAARGHPGDQAAGRDHRRRPALAVRPVGRGGDRHLPARARARRSSSGSYARAPAASCSRASSAAATSAPGRASCCGSPRSRRSWPPGPWTR